MNEEKIQLSMGEAVIRELNFGDENNALRRAVQEAILHGSATVDLVTKKECLLLESITKAPFPKTLEALRSIPRSDGLKLSAAYTRLNEVTQGELTRSVPLSSTESTPAERLE